MGPVPVLGFPFQAILSCVFHPSPPILPSGSFWFLLPACGVLQTSYSNIFTFGVLDSQTWAEFHFRPLVLLESVFSTFAPTRPHTNFELHRVLSLFHKLQGFTAPLKLCSLILGCFGDYPLPYLSLAKSRRCVVGSPRSLTLSRCFPGLFLGTLILSPCGLGIPGY